MTAYACIRCEGCCLDHGEVLHLLNIEGKEIRTRSHRNVAKVLQLINDGTISGRIAKMSSRRPSTAAVTRKR